MVSELSCDWCDGTGQRRYFKGDECQACRGTGRLPPQTERPVVPCAAGHSREIKTIGLFPRAGQASWARYAEWARGGGRNPWCSIQGCPEAEP